MLAAFAILLSNGDCYLYYCFHYELVSFSRKHVRSLHVPHGGLISSGFSWPPVDPWT